MLLGDKVFVTGIYASGKTTFVENYIKDNRRYARLSFDQIYGYKDRGERLDLVYKVMDSVSCFMMDALPLINHEHWLRFVDYLKDKNYTIVLVECDIDVWARERLPTKAAFSDAPIEKHKEWFNSFYETTAKSVERTFTDNVVYYYSDTDTLTKVKRC